MTTLFFFAIFLCAYTSSVLEEVTSYSFPRECGYTQRLASNEQKKYIEMMICNFGDRIINALQLLACSLSQIGYFGGSQLSCHQDTQEPCGESDSCGKEPRSFTNYQQGNKASCQQSCKGASSEVYLSDLVKPTDETVLVDSLTTTL